MGGFAINFDLKSGYHHLDICPHHRQYLGFAWMFPDGRERFFKSRLDYLLLLTFLQNC